jgi:hypothetical protein
MSNPYIAIDKAAMLERPDLLNSIFPLMEEMERRIHHPGLAWIPDDHPERNQLAFHQSDKRIRLLFGGNQSGKSHAAAMEVAWAVGGIHPFLKVREPCQVYVISATLRNLKMGVWRHLQNVLFEWDVKRFGPRLAGDVPVSIEMHNGSTIEFISGEGAEQAREKLASAAVDLVVIDEEIHPVLWDELMARRLAYGGKVIISATLLRSEDWILELEERAELGDPTVDLFRLRTRRAMDLGHVDRQTFEEMDAHLSEEDKQVRLEGHSRRRQGLVYPEFTKKHIIDEPFEIPADWTRYCSIDPGWRTAAVLWGAVSPDGKAVIYREGYFHSRTYKELAEFIFRAEGYIKIPAPDKECGYRFIVGPDTEPIFTRWIDPAGFQHSATGEVGIAAMLASEYAMYCSPANNQVHVGIEMVKQRLMLGMDGQPGLKIFRSAAPNLIKEFKQYRWVEDRGGRSHERSDSPVKRNDHALDALRYMLIGGMAFVTHTEEYQREMQKRDYAGHGINASAAMQERLAQWWVKRNWETKHGSQKEHVGGLGSIF